MGKLKKFYICLSGILLSFANITITEAMPIKENVKSMVVFGDSLSDTGNTAHLLKSIRQDESPGYLVEPLKVFFTNRMRDYADAYHVPQIILDEGISLVSYFFDYDLGPILASLIYQIKHVPVIPQEPYWHEHFSNGPVWNEYLARMLQIDPTNKKQFENQAFGGSWASTFDHQLNVWNFIRQPRDTLKNILVGRFVPPSLGLTLQAQLMRAPLLNHEAVYFVLAGGNDYLNMLTNPDNYNHDVMDKYIDNVVGAIENSVQKMVQADATKFIVFGLPDVGLTPHFNTTPQKNILSDVVATHNERVKASVEDLQRQYPHLSFLYVDVQSFLEKILDNPSNYGLSNVKDACIDVKLPDFEMFQGLNQPDSPFATNFVLAYAALLEKSKQLSEGAGHYTVCHHPDTYLFWDEIHPTTRAHYYLAYEICRYINKNGYRCAA